MVNRQLSFKRTNLLVLTLTSSSPSTQQSEDSELKSSEVMSWLESWPISASFLSPEEALLLPAVPGLIGPLLKSSLALIKVSKPSQFVSGSPKRRPELKKAPFCGSPLAAVFVLFSDCSAAPSAPCFGSWMRVKPPGRVTPGGFWAPESC